MGNKHWPKAVMVFGWEGNHTAMDHTLHLQTLRLVKGRSNFLCSSTTKAYFIFTVTSEQRSHKNVDVNTCMVFTYRR